jgi:formamidopyrimidine-DNA glycosylase
VTEIVRIGKFVVMTLSSNGRERPMLVHLRMSGRLDVLPQAEAFTKHARVVWQLDDGFALCFDDARKFGRVYLPEDISEIADRIGPDALTISVEAFTARVGAKKGVLKSVLLDQRVLAGVGNIYADESLHQAQIKPTRRANTLTQVEAQRLHAAVRDVLLEGIAANGASFDWVYPGGNYQDNFRVYGQTGQPCRRCGTVIKRIVVGQRSTHFCPKCQR